MIYLDNAATSYPKPPAIYETAESVLRELGANPGRGAFAMALATSERLERTRSALCEFFGGADPTRFVLTFNTTDSLNIAIKGALAGKKGHIVTSRLEHNSVWRNINRFEDEGFEVTRLAPDAEGFLVPEQVADALRDDTRLVALTHCSNVLGSIQPIAEIGAIVAEHPALFLVDAAQSAGVLEIDVDAMQIDLLAFAGHKGLLGPTGTGGLYVREGVELEYWREGGSGRNSHSPRHPLTMPHRYEAGTPNTLGLCLLLEGLEYVRERGTRDILAHERRLTARAIEGLRDDPRFTLYGPAGMERRSGVLLLNVRSIDPVPAAEALDARFDIAVRPALQCAPDTHRLLGTYPNGAIRVSPGCFNTEADIDALLAALGQIADEAAAQ